ncbi:MAG: ferritin-like domain-containing protein [Alphaproteobacteria bacterium]|nr:ferritin-like domain-containing protein [Alphaproteobacteria bacterium]
MKIGSEAHKEFFCRHFKETYQEFDPKALPWPELNQAELERLRSVPFWQEVFYTERRAGAIVAAFTETVKDPVLKEAIALQGLEEARHAELIREMIRRYGIDAQELPMEQLSADVETAFKDFGFGECVDSFLGFGVFKMARQSSFLPESMFEIFDVLMYEETRHIVFFVNWMAYNQARRGFVSRTLLPLVSFRYYIRAFKRMVGTARRGAAMNDGKEFAATQASVFIDGFNFRRFLEDCYGENRRRMSVFEPEMLRPSFLPQLAETALAALRLWSFRSKPQTPA